MLCCHIERRRLPINPPINLKAPQGPQVCSIISMSPGLVYCKAKLPHSNFFFSTELNYRRRIHVFLVYMIYSYKLFPSRSSDLGRRNIEELEGRGNIRSCFWGKRMWKREECGFCPVGWEKFGSQILSEGHLGT